MPGIFGIILKDKSKRDDLKSQFEQMGKYLTHYSYYKIEAHYGDDFIVGQVGLPFRNFAHKRYDANSKKGMVFDGMMYGWRGDPLEKTPHLHAPVDNIKFEKFDSLKKVPTLINGSFNTILFDEENDYFCIGNSRLGNRSFFYYEDDDVIAFAPEIKGFLALKSNSCTLDEHGMVNFFNYSFLNNGNTLMKGAKRIYPASIIEINNRKMNDSYRYWEYSFTNELDGDVDEYAKKFYDKGMELNARQMGDEKKFFMALSGGMDSRLLAKYCSLIDDKDITYYTHGYKNSYDVQLAEEVATVLGIKDKFNRLEISSDLYVKLGNWTAWLVDGMTFIYSAFVNSVIEKYPENPLDYEFANSQFSGALNFSFGYDSNDYIVENMPYDKMLKMVGSVFNSNYLNDEYYALFKPEIVSEMKKRFYPDIEVELNKHIKSHKYFTSIYNKVTLDSKSVRYMNTYDLYRFVFNWHFSLIDDEMFEMYTQTPIKLNSERIMYKRMFINHAPELAKILYEKTGADLMSPKNQSYINRKARNNKIRHYLARLSRGKINLYDRYNYVQANQWYRKVTENRKYFESILLDNRTLSRGYFNPQSIKQILTKQKNGGNYFGVISQLTAFELFNRYFVDKEEPPKNPMEKSY